MDDQMSSRWDDSPDAPLTFHTRTTFTRLSSVGPGDADQYLEEADLDFIPGRRPAIRQKTPLGTRLLSKLAILPLVALLLVGAGAFGLNLAHDCAGKQRCPTVNLLRSFAGNPNAIPTPTMTATPGLPPIPNDVPANVHHFLTIALPYAVQAHKALNWPTSVIMALWGLEQGWDVPSYTGYNWGNVSAIEGEPSVGGIDVPGSPAAFAYARTPADGLRYFLSAARLPYYAKVAPAAKQGGPDAAAVALGESPWDANHYTVTGMPGSSLLAILHDFNFYRLDVGQGA
jgi:hypothetical protein